MRVIATSAGVGAHFAWQHDRPHVWDGLKSLVLDRPLTRRKQPLAGDALRLLRSLERLLIATAAAEADRDLAEEEAAWNAARELVDPPGRDT
jgi:hypothetical protein